MNREQTTLLIQGVRYTKQILLEDVNIPYKLTCDKTNNHLYFCINADEFSEHSFHVVDLDLDSGSPYVIPGVRNGFASAVDQETGTVYIGASDGIWQYDQTTKRVKPPRLVSNVDILDMFFCNHLFFVQTSNQKLYEYDGMEERIVSKMEKYLMEHFIFDSCGDLFFVNRGGLFHLAKGTKVPSLNVDSDMNFRGAAINKNGDPYFISDTGIYSIDKGSERLRKIAQISNGYGLAFDCNDNIIYSDERTLNILIQDK